MFFTEKNLQNHFSLGRAKNGLIWKLLIHNCWFEAEMKLKWLRLQKKYKENIFCFVCHYFGGNFVGKIPFLTEIRKKLSQHLIEENGHNSFKVASADQFFVEKQFYTIF